MWFILSQHWYSVRIQFFCKFIFMVGHFFSRWASSSSEYSSTFITIAVGREWDRREKKTFEVHSYSFCVRPHIEPFYLRFFVNFCISIVKYSTQWMFHMEKLLIRQKIEYGTIRSTHTHTLLESTGGLPIAFPTSSRFVAGMYKSLLGVALFWWKENLPINYVAIYSMLSSLSSVHEMGFNCHQYVLSSFLSM